MTAQTKTVLKSYFETGDRPTEQQFADLIDSIPGDAGVLSESEIPATIARDTEVTAAVSAHAAASDPHGDRAYAAAQDAAHVSASDPHGDRAYAAAAILAGAAGGATVSDQVLKAWTQSGAYERTVITYDGTYTDVMSTATIKWPDGSAGTLTVDTINSTWAEIDAYHITHTVSGKTITQAAVTRNANGYVTAKPALTVA